MSDVFEQALICHQAGEVERAKRLYSQVLEENPAQYQAYHNLGILAQQAGDFSLAVSFLQKAIAVNPAYTKAYLNLGNLFRDHRQFEQAALCYQQLLQYDPTHQLAQMNLAAICYEKGEMNRAEFLFKQVIAQDSEYGPAYHNLGCLYYNQQRFQEALISFKKALELGPLYVEGYYYLGNTYHELQCLGQAAEAYRAALAIEPDHMLSRWNLANSLLVNGEWAEGLFYYESRLAKYPVYEAYGLSRKREWKGEDLSGKTILIFPEQGLGDTIQFVRYVSNFVRWNCRCLVAVQLPLLSLMKRSLAPYPFVTVVESKQDVIEKYKYDYLVSLLSLPGIFSTRPTTIPEKIPLLLNSDLVAYWSGKLSNKGVRVGLVWAGNPEHVYDKKRSCSLTDLLPLLDIADIQWYSLQLGAGRQQLSSCENSGKVIDLSSSLQSFDDTAAVIYNLDLVITVDTAVCHLAATLGKRTWLLLYHQQHDWRWEQEEKECPWYEKFRLYRQEYLGDWKGVVEKVRADLRLESVRWLRWVR